MYKSWPLDSLTESDRLILKEYASATLTHGDIMEMPDRLQGFCSYTLQFTGAVHCYENAQAVVQFRPTKFALDLEVTREARVVYGDYTPMTRLLSRFDLAAHGTLQVTLQSRVPGVSYDQIRPSKHRLEGAELARHRRLVTSFADLIARGWNRGRSSTYTHCLTGKVGGSLVHRLRALSHHLPNSDLRSIAAAALDNLQGLDVLPVVLTHGDLIPSNIMANTTTHSIEGLIDWAEAEWLPFGMCLYGLEHLLGYVSADDKHFVYYSAAEELRHHFWLEFSRRIFVDEVDGYPGSAIKLARDIGVLLWYGFAWDDGAIDRVISARDDPTELMFLHTFLQVPCEDVSARL